MYPEKTKRSLRRCRRRLASYRRRFLARVRQAAGMVTSEPERVVSRIPTRQEKRTAEALKHDLREPAVSQFAISTQPHVSPLLVVQRVKGRLQYLVRQRRPKAFQGNYAIRSVGHVTRQCIEAYVADQLGHHRMADPRIQARFAPYQIERPDVDLSQPQKTSHGIYWYNLHVVLVHRERWMEVREEVLQRVHDMIVRVCEGKGYRLSRAGILADHVHLVLGCPIQLEIGL